jgi:hypothetical protein
MFELTLPYITLLMNIVTGDEVSFIVKHTPKGVQADGLQLMIPEVTTKSIRVYPLNAVEFNFNVIQADQ